jgi:hypothetical protein
LLVLLERWRVEAAADQFAADLRLAHTRPPSSRKGRRASPWPAAPIEDT